MRTLITALLVATLSSACGGGSGASSGDGSSNPPPAPTVNLEASPASVSAGGETTLTWNSTNATGCTASDGWSGAKATSGSETIGSLSASKNFSLACSGVGGSTAKTITVMVTAPPAPTLVLNANPGTVTAGASSTLSWSTTNATTCTASGGWTGSKPTGGSQSTGAISSTTSYTLACTGAGGSVSRTISVSVDTIPPPPAPSVSLAANPTSVTSGASSTLTWSSTNATGCTASGGWSGSKATSGSQSTGALTSNASFTLTCTGSGGSASLTVGVSVTSPPAPTVTLTASPATVQSGGSSMLAWSSTNATACAASGGWSGSKATSGSQSTGALNSTASYTLVCTGSGGSASDSMTVAVGTSAAARFPLHTEAGKRYLIDANGQPFFVHGDTAWSLMVQLTRAEVDQYLENRRLKGFNTILVELMEKSYSANPPYNRYGDAPFNVAGDFSTPNESYFAHVEYVIAKAAEKGMLVMITPSYMGYGGGVDGWYREMDANGETKLREFGRYVATRLAAYDNILWIQGGDYNPPEKLLMRALASGIRDVNAGALQSFHGARGTSALGFLGTTESWANVNNIYTTSSTVVENAFIEYARSTMPFFLIEAGYEGDGTDSKVARMQAYQSVLSGAMGHLYGNTPVWHFNAPSWPNPSGATWQEAMNDPGARSLTHLQSLIESLAWWTMQPDVGNTLLTDGIGSTVGRAVAGRAGNGAFALIYMPSFRTITINFSRLSGPNVRARWYDPTSGSHTEITGSPFPATGSRSLTPPATNSSGYSDWVLVLESMP